MQEYITVLDVPMIMSVIAKFCEGGKAVEIEVKKKVWKACTVKLVGKGVLEREFQIQLTLGKVNNATIVTLDYGGEIRI